MSGLGGGGLDSNGRAVMSVVAPNKKPAALRERRGQVPSKASSIGWRARWWGNFSTATAARARQERNPGPPQPVGRRPYESNSEVRCSGNPQDVWRTRVERQSHPTAWTEVAGNGALVKFLGLLRLPTSIVTLQEGLLGVLWSVSIAPMGMAHSL